MPFTGAANPGRVNSRGLGAEGGCAPLGSREAGPPQPLPVPHPAARDASTRGQCCPAVSRVGWQVCLRTRVSLGCRMYFIPASKITSRTPGEISIPDKHRMTFFSTRFVLNITWDVVQSLGCVPLFGTPQTAARQASLSITKFRSLFKLMSIELVMPSNHLIFCRHVLLLPSIFPRIRVFSNELALCIRWPKHWSFSFNPSKEYSGLISFRMDWFDLFEVQGTLKSLPLGHICPEKVLTLG